MYTYFSDERADVKLNINRESMDKYLKKLTIESSRTANHTVLPFSKHNVIIEQKSIVNAPNLGLSYIVYVYSNMCLFNFSASFHRIYQLLLMGALASALT